MPRRVDICGNTRIDLSLSKVSGVSGIMCRPLWVDFTYHSSRHHSAAVCRENIQMMKLQVVLLLMSLLVLHVLAQRFEKPDDGCPSYLCYAAEAKV